MIPWQYILYVYLAIGGIVSFLCLCSALDPHEYHGPVWQTLIGLTLVIIFWFPLCIKFGLGDLMDSFK